MKNKILRQLLLFLLVLYENNLIGQGEENSAKENLNTITVTGTRRKGFLKDSTIMTEVIGRKDIDAMGAKDLSESLGNVPGIEVRPAQAGERGSTLRLQGLSAQNVLILVDGQRTTGRFNGAIDLTRFKVDDIERIEIVKGASSALYGSDSIAGVINVITKEAKHPLYGEFRTMSGSGSEKFYGPYLDFRNYATVGAKSESLSTLFTVGWHKGEGYDLTPDSTVGPRNGRTASLAPGYNPYINGTTFLSSYIYSTRLPMYTPPLESTTGGGFNDLNLSNKSTFQATPDLLITTTLYYRYLHQTAVDAVLPRTVFDRTNKTYDIMGAVNADWAVTQKSSLNFNVNHSRFQDLYNNDQRKSDELDTQQRTDNGITEIRTRVDYKFNVNHITSVGVENLQDRLSSARVSQDCKRSFPYICPEDLNPDFGKGQSINGNVFRFRNAIFLQDEWRVSDSPKIQIVPGIRYDHDSIYGGEWLPKLAVRYDINEKLRIRLANGLGFRAPSFQDLYFNFLNPGVGYRVAGNPNLKPELSRSYNVGWEWDISKHIWFSNNFYHNNVDNLIGFRTNPVRDNGGLLVYQTSNYKKATTSGFETSFQIRVNEMISSGIGYTFTDTKDETTGLPLEGRGPHRWNLNVKMEDRQSGVSISIFAVVFGKQAYYCVKNPIWCNPDLPENFQAIESAINTESQRIIQNALGVIPSAVSEFCSEANQSYCTTNQTFGYRMVNPHTNLNLRISQKFFTNFQWFLGIDNALDSWDTTYNPQKPKFIYFGLDGKFTFQENEKKI